MPTPPFSPDRQAWIQEIGNLFFHKSSRKESLSPTRESKFPRTSISSYDSYSSYGSSIAVAKPAKKD